MGRLSQGINSMSRLKKGGKGAMSGTGTSGFSDAQIREEMERAAKQLRELGKEVDMRGVRRIQRKSLAIAEDNMKAEITDNDTGFVVYEKGRIRGKTHPGQLRESIGIIKGKVREPKLFSALSVGPRVTGEFGSTERGGWFAHFLEYGYLRMGKGKNVELYRGKNYRFASRANAKSMRVVRLDFEGKMRKLVDRKIKLATRK